MFELFGHGVETAATGIFLEEAALDYVVSPVAKSPQSYALVEVNASGERRWMGYAKEALPYLAETTGRFLPADAQLRLEARKHVDRGAFDVEEYADGGGPRARI